MLSGYQDSNLGPPVPKTGALPGCATSRKYRQLHCCVIAHSAESEGFEPSVQFDPYVGLANRWFQPLTQLSVEWDAKIQPPVSYLQVKTPTFFLFPSIQGASNP